MGFFGGGYDKAGPGIPKMPMEKKGIFKFLEVYGRRFWKLMEINLLFLLFCIPIITIGPAIAGMTKVCRNYSQERNAFVYADFIDAFKKNFKQSLAVWLIDLVVIVLSSIGLPVYFQLAQQNKAFFIPLGIYLACLLIYFMMHFYIYLMIVSTNLKFKQIIKNSFLLVSIGTKASFFTLLNIVLTVLVIFVFFFNYVTLGIDVLLILLWSSSFLCFVTTYNCYPVIRKYVIEPYYKSLGVENPEFEYLRTEQEAVFTDKGGTEEPIGGTKRKKRGKRIS